MTLADHLRHLAELYADAELRAAADHIDDLEAEIGRLRYFVQTIDEHAEAISTEVAIALHTHGGPSHD